MRDGLTISVDRTQLLKTLQENRASHGAAYETAKAGYIKVVSKQLREHIERLADGDLAVRVYVPAPPDDHTSDYDDAIEMMKWSQSDSIELDQGQFRQYVQDDWGWKNSWVTSNTEYIAAGAR